MALTVGRKIDRGLWIRVDEAVETLKERKGSSAFCSTNACQGRRFREGLQDSLLPHPVIQLGPTSFPVPPFLRFGEFRALVLGLKDLSERFDRWSESGRDGELRVLDELLLVLRLEGLLLLE